MLREYRWYELGARAEQTVAQAQEIIEDMAGQGYVLTLRQLYYQFVRRNWIDNEEREYKRLGRVVTQAREMGLISWTAIEDRGRGHSAAGLCEDEAEALEGVEYGLTLDLWARQGVYVEVWVEKQALESVVARPCRGLRAPFMACKGYLSSSEAWRAGQRFLAARDAGRRCVMLHLGDHDPSGMDMTRDNLERLELFSEGSVEVRRLALNIDQVRAFAPPPNPTKVTDSRAVDYVRRFGHECWELDALEPRELDRIITGSLRGLIDPATWNDALREERERRSLLSLVSQSWPDVSELLMGLHPDWNLGHMEQDDDASEYGDE